MNSIAALRQGASHEEATHTPEPMKPITRPLLPTGVLLLFSLVSTLQLVSCSEWAVPKTLVGTWSATQDVTVRYQSGIASFRFVKAPVHIALNIRGDGTVEGTVGGARFEQCSVSRNRGWFGKTFNLYTDYIISGILSGNIFQQDTIPDKEISLPFNMKEDTLAGAIFQKQGMDIFPMVNTHLTKQ